MANGPIETLMFWRAASLQAPKTFLFHFIYIEGPSNTMLCHGGRLCHGVEVSDLWVRSRLDQGRRRGLATISKKSLATWQHGNIFFSRFLKFPDFQSISLFQKWRKFAFSKAPPFDFSPKISDFLMPSRGCSRMPIMPIRNSQN